MKLINENKKFNTARKSLKEGYFLGLPKAEFVDHGAWSDFEILYDNHSYNGNEIQDSAWESFQEDVEEGNFELEEGEDIEDDDAFIRWAQDDPYRVYEYLDMAIPHDNVMFNDDYYIITDEISTIGDYSICKFLNKSNDWDASYLYGIVENYEPYEDIDLYDDTLHKTVRECMRIIKDNELDESIKSTKNYKTLKESKKLNETLTDAIFDRMDGEHYDPKEFYNYLMRFDYSWYQDVTRAMDYGEEEDVVNALINGVRHTVIDDGGDPENPNAKQLYDWIRNTKWLEETDEMAPRPKYLSESKVFGKHHKALKEDTYDLGTQFDKRQSFYGKAKVTIDKEGNKVLYSYNEPVCKITKTGEVLLGDAWNFSSTTLRHIKEFLSQNNKTVGTKKDIGKMYRVTNLKESKRNLKEDVSSYAISSAIYDVLGALEDDFQDVVEDIVDRAMTSIDEGSDREDAIYEAMDEGLIYTADEWAMIEHYCDPHSANYDDAYSGLMSDVESVIDQIIEDRDDDEDDEEFDESLKESKEEDYVLYKEGDTIYGTPKSNYNIQYANGNLIRNYTKSGFKSVEDIKKYLTKYSKNNVRIIDKTNESLKRKVASRRK